MFYLKVCAYNALYRPTKTKIMSPLPHAETWNGNQRTDHFKHIFFLTISYKTHHNYWGFFTLWVFWCLLRLHKTEKCFHTADIHRVYLQCGSSGVLEGWTVERSVVHTECSFCSAELLYSSPPLPSGRTDKPDRWCNTETDNENVV